MGQRFISAEQSIAAAGAAFACMDEDYSDIASARHAARRAHQVWNLDAVSVLVTEQISKFLKWIGFGRS